MAGVASDLEFVTFPILHPHRSHSRHEQRYCSSWVRCTFVRTVAIRLVSKACLKLVASVPSITARGQDDSLFKAWHPRCVRTVRNEYNQSNIQQFILFICIVIYK